MTDSTDRPARVSILPFYGLALAMLLAACNQDAASISAPIRPVRTQRVEIIEWKQASSAIGEIKPRYESDLAFRIAGKVVARPVDVGAVVTRGMLVASLDNTSEQTT